MKAKEFKEKAEEIRLKMLEVSEKKLIRSKDSWDFVYEPNKEIRDLAREFIHLVYAYDKDLPLNRELENLEDTINNLHREWGEHRKSTIMDYVNKIDFFIHYITDYVGIDDKNEE